MVEVLAEGRVLVYWFAYDLAGNQAWFVGDVKRGEALVISGESGSGKTTLLGLMAGLDSADQGEVILLGQSLADKSEEQRASIRNGRVGFVFQSFHLVTGATALQNVMLPLELAGAASPGQRAQQVLLPPQVALAS